MTSAPGVCTATGDPKLLRRQVHNSLRQLRREQLDLYYLHRIDERVPLEESWGALSDLVREGKIRWLGLSEVTSSQADSAERIHPVSAVQSELSVWTRDPLHAGEEERQSILSWTKMNDAVFVAFAPLGRGFFTEGYRAETAFERTDFRASNGRFSDAARVHNQPIKTAVRTIAQSSGASESAVAIAWVLAQGSNIVSIPGSRNAEHIKSNLAGAELSLSKGDLTSLDSLPPATGARY